MSPDPSEARLLDFTGRLAVVTGGGGEAEGWGNGQAIATLLARQGAHVVVVDRDPAAAAETLRRIREEDGLGETAQADVTQPADVEALVDGVLDRHGRLDVLINNVGRSEPGGPEELTPEVWNAQFAVNVTSAYLTCRAALPVMVRAGGGVVVNISSVAGLRYIGKPQSAYAAAKAALLHFTRTTAVLYASKGVRLNCVVPGLMHTPLVARLADKYAGGDYDRFVARRNGQAPMGRMGTAWDVAHATAFLASDQARYITGAELVVDGAFTVATP